MIIRCSAWLSRSLNLIYCYRECVCLYGRRWYRAHLKQTGTTVGSPIARFATVVLRQLRPINAGEGVIPLTR